MTAPGPTIEAFEALDVDPTAIGVAAHPVAGLTLGPAECAVNPARLGRMLDVLRVKCDRLSPFQARQYPLNHLVDSFQHQIYIIAASDAAVRQIRFSRP